MEKLLTTKEIAHYYGVSIRTIQRRVKDGTLLPAENPLGLLRFRNPESDKPEWQKTSKTERRRIVDNMLNPKRKKRNGEEKTDNN